MTCVITKRGLNKEYAAAKTLNEIYKKMRTNTNIKRQNLQQAASNFATQ